MKKLLSILLASTMLVSLTACSSNEETAETTTETTTTEATTELSGEITVISREDGSGTRGAFVEITGVDSGEGDNTTLDAVIQDGTGKVMTAVAQDPNAIGYISLGSLNDTVKAISVDGVEATVENINSGDYKVARPFNIATKTGAELSEVTAELLDFFFTAEAQAIVEAEGFISVDATTTEFTSAQPTGTVTIGGSTSVSPVMEKLVEAYKALNPNATINLESIGSSAGMQGAIDGTFDIGMASRELKDSETAELTGMVLSMDGIALVVNNENPLDNLTMEQIMNIYIGEITDYSELG